MTSVLARVLIMIALSLLLTPLVASSESEAKHKTLFAVVPDAPVCADVSRDWLPIGVAFDLEKRLCRLPALEAADRLAVTAALQEAAGGTEASKVQAVTKRTGAGIVIYVSASAKGEHLSLTADIWSKGQRVASLARGNARLRDFRSAGLHSNPETHLSDLFGLIDGIIDDTVAELGKAGVDIGKPDSVPGLKWHPARSVAAYEDLISGMVLLQRGDVSRAKPLLLKTLSAEPDNWFAHYFLGAVMLYQGDIAKAAQYCREAISINADFYPGVYANLSYCCAAMAEDKQADWAKLEFERRTGKPLPARTVPGGMPPESFGMRP